MKKVSIIIVNYNTKAVLNECLRNLEGIYADLEIIVVDNASSDGSAAMVKATFANVILIEAQNNGLAAGYNLALEKATGDYILFLGSDAFPELTTVEGMVGFFEENSDVGIATCKLILRDGNLDMDAHRGFPTPWAALTHFSGLNKFFFKSKIFNRYFLGWHDLDKPHEIDLCISHFMMVRKKVFEDVGSFDEGFFVYGEDVDFCYRAKYTGWKVMYLPQWQATHYKGVTVGTRKESADITKASEETVSKMKKSSVDAIKIFYEKHYVSKYPKIITWAIFKAIDFLYYTRR